MGGRGVIKDNIGCSAIALVLGIFMLAGFALDIHDPNSQFAREYGPVIAIGLCVLGGVGILWWWVMVQEEREQEERRRREEDKKSPEGEGKE